MDRYEIPNLLQFSFLMCKKSMHYVNIQEKYLGAIYVLLAVVYMYSV